MESINMRERIVYTISILSSILFFLFLRLEFKYILLYFLMNSTIIISNFIFSNVLSYDEYNSKIIMVSSILGNFIITIIAYYLGQKIILCIPILINVMIVVYLEKINKKQINNLIDTNILECEIQLENAMRRLEVCYDKLKRLYEINEKSNTLDIDFLDQIGLRLDDLNSEKKILNNRIKSKNLDSDVINEISLKIVEFHIEIENTRMGLDKIFNVLRGESFSKEIANKAYVDNVKLIDNTLAKIVNNAKKNKKVNLKVKEEIIDGVNEVYKKIDIIIDSFQSDSNRISKNLDNNPKSLIDALVEFDCNINSNLNQIYSIIKHHMNDLQNVVIEYEGFIAEIKKNTNFKEAEIENIKSVCLEEFNARINNLKLNDAKELELYKLCFSEKGFELLNNGEMFYNLLKNNNKELKDYSTIYISYTKFLEIEIRRVLKLKGRMKSLYEMINMLRGIKEWEPFIKAFDERKIRTKRNIAAHGCSGVINKEDVENIRLFIFDDDKMKILYINN